MGLYADIFKWILKTILSVAIAGFVIFTCFFLLRFTEEWIQEQSSRTHEARAKWEAAVERSSAEVKRLEGILSEEKRKLSGASRSLRDITRRINETNEGIKWLKAYTPGVGETPQEYQKRKDNYYKQKLDQEKLVRQLRENVKKLDKQWDTLINDDPNAENIQAAKEEYESEKRLLEQRERTINDISSKASIAWNEAQPYLIACAFGIIFSPWIWKVFAFYVIGAIAAKFRPVTFSGQSTNGAAQRISASKPAFQIKLQDGDAIILKEEFLQGIRGGMKRRTQFFWKWKYPVISYLAKLVMLTRIESGKEGGAVTLSSHNDPFAEIVRIDLVEGECFVFRPGFLVGYQSGEREVKIKTILRFRLNNWLTLHFRYFLVEGPGQIYLCAGRGFETEELKDDQFAVDRDIPALFSPSLQFKSRRAETFWGYALGKNSLLDDHYQGTGIILCQQVKGGVAGRDAESIWGKILATIGKAIGL